MKEENIDLKKFWYGWIASELSIVKFLRLSKALRTGEFQEAVSEFERNMGVLFNELNK